MKIITENNHPGGSGVRVWPCTQHRSHFQSQTGHTLTFSHTFNPVQLLTPFLTRPSQWDMWTVNSDGVANEPKSLFEDYIWQVHRALLNKTLVYIVAANLQLMPKEILSAQICNLLKSSSNGYFKRAAIISIRCISFLHARPPQLRGWDEAGKNNSARFGSKRFAAIFRPQMLKWRRKFTLTRTRPIAALPALDQNDTQTFLYDGNDIHFLSCSCNNCNAFFCVALPCFGCANIVLIIIIKYFFILKKVQQRSML